MEIVTLSCGGIDTRKRITWYFLFSSDEESSIMRHFLKLYFLLLLVPFGSSAFAEEYLHKFGHVHVYGLPKQVAKIEGPTYLETVEFISNITNKGLRRYSSFSEEVAIGFDGCNVWQWKVQTFHDGRLKEEEWRAFDLKKGVPNKRPVFEEHHFVLKSVNSWPIVKTIKWYYPMGSKGAVRDKLDKPKEFVKHDEIFILHHVINGGQREQLQKSFWHLMNVCGVPIKTKPLFD